MAKRDRTLERTYSLGAVARLTGLSPHVLRAWERRYEAVQPLRTPGGTRRYRESDVERLRMLRSLVESGHSIGEVAAASERELVQRLAMQPELPEPALAPIYAAIAELDASALTRLMGLQLSALGARDFVHRVASPVLREVGARWVAGDVCVASEHLASATLRSLLGAALHPGSAGSRAAPILFTTLPGDPHDLGALMAAVIAADIGARAIFVGGALPVEEIAIASERTGATAVVLGSSYDAGGALHSLRALRAQLPAAVDLWIGGETEHLAGKVAGVVYLADLVELERKVTLFCERRP